MIKVIIVEDESAIARGLSELITRYHPEFEVLALCRNGRDGLEKILAHKPHLVFADINMPVMDGLEMITQVQACGFLTNYVILTGHAEFEYARAAVKLGVSDYLLKPITPDMLNEIMKTCRQKYLSSLRQLQMQYLQQCFAHRDSSLEDKNPLFGYSCTLLFLFLGPVYRSIYHETIIRVEFEPDHTAVFRQLEEQYQVSLFLLNGQHCNEFVCAVVYPCLYTPDIPGIAQQLYQTFEPPGSFLNIIISRTNRDGLRMHELIRETRLFALFNNPFSSTIQNCSATPNRSISVSREIKHLCAGLPKQPTQELLHHFVHSMITFWSSRQVTQFQLITDIRFFINTILQDSPNENESHSDATEIISSCHNYQELEKELYLELRHFYGFCSRNLPQEQLALPQQVRNWLDNHFTTQISYKIFQDTFGYNEKYISALFKAEYGISPCKYIGELRLDMAQKLMQANPDILLKDVAEMTGFSDAFYFSRVFKSNEGISPSQYLKQLKEKQER